MNIATVECDDDLVAAVHDQLVNEIAQSAQTTHVTELAARAVSLISERAPLLGAGRMRALADAVMARLEGLGPLEPLLAEPYVTDIMVNGDGAVWVERSGRLEHTGIEMPPEYVRHLIDRVIAPLGRRIDRMSPLVDARLPDGSRVNAVIPPLAIDGPCLTIRRFGTSNRRIEEFGDAALAALLGDLITERYNVIVSGGTGAGKTSLLNALTAEIPRHERVITIEDAAELRLPGDHVIRLEARPANAEGVGEITIRTLVRNALRMRPDRIIVGEVRGPEAIDMVQAMNTGHDGSLSTCHANSPSDALRRLETLILMSDVDLPLAAAREQLVSSIDVVVQVARTNDGRRQVTAVEEVGFDLDDRGRIATRPIWDGTCVVGEMARPSRRGLNR